MSAEYEKFIPMFAASRVATTAEVSANKFIVAVPYVVTGCVVNHRTAAGLTYTTAQAVEIKKDATTGACTIEVVGTAVTAGDVVSVVAWK